MAMEAVVVVGLKVVLKVGIMFGVVKLPKEVGVIEVFSSAKTSLNYIYLIKYIFIYLKEVIGEVVKVVDMEVDQCEEILVTTEQYHIIQAVVIFVVEIIKLFFINSHII